MVARSSALVTPTAAPQRRVAPRHRLLGTLGMLGSPFLFLSFAAAGFQQDGTTRLGSFLGLLFALGWFSNVLGLWTLGATGRRLPSKIILGLELVGVTLACLFQVYEFVAPGATSLLYTITDIAWPLSMLTLIVVGIAVLVARVMRGWARFVPLACGLWLPVGIAASMIVGTTAGVIIGELHVAIGWLLLGYAVRNGAGVTAHD
jgi:hypothetical protein